MAADIELRGNQLMVVCRGRAYTRGAVTINRANPGNIETVVRGMIGLATQTYFAALLDDAAGQEVARINVANAVARIQRQLAAPARAERPTAPAREPTPPRVIPARTPAGTVQDRRRPAAMESPPAIARPTISIEWIEQQLRDVRVDDRRAQAAVTTTHSLSAYVDRFLAPTAQRGTERTDTQRDATIVVFNALYQIPTFRLYLSSVVARERTNYPEFLRLEEFLNTPTAGGRLSAQAGTEIIRAADMYTRYFLFDFIASNSNYARYREEIATVPQAETRRSILDNSRTIQGSGNLDAGSRAAFARVQVQGPMDASTLVGALLFVRRWQLEHPTRGRGRTQDQIDVWHAPTVIPIEESTARAAVPSRTAEPAAPRAADATTVSQIPRVGIIGDSITDAGNNRYGRTLQGILREQWPTAVVDSHGVSGQSILQIRDRFRREIVSHIPPYNTVVIQGGVNNIMGVPPAQAQNAVTEMIATARAQHMRVVLLPITPWSGYRTSSGNAQQRTYEFNAWLRTQANGTDVVVADLSTLGDGEVPRLRAEYRSRGNESELHPNDTGLDVIARQIAQAAFASQATRATAPGTTSGPVTLDQFATQNWRDLTGILSRSVQGGADPVGVVRIARNLPVGQRSVEAALQQLNRQDISRAIDQIYNTYFSLDQDFVIFCRTRDDYRSLFVGAPITLSAGTDASTRGSIVRAMMEFVNDRAATSATEDWRTRLRGDLATLYRGALNIQRNDLQVNGVEDLRLIAAAAVYQWRLTHRLADAGSWARPLDITPVAPTAVPVEEPRRARR